ncbi:MAG: hypothetical protein HC853_12100 [Anaerolineae bacterium]|nr:hypothetical protein [Anaerolineae bacterium]
MSDVNKAGNPQPDPGSRMSDEFIARALAESGRRTPPLSPSVQANILKAMLAENARQVAAEARPAVKPRVQTPSQPQPSWWDSLLRWLNPPVARGLGGAFAAILLASLYVLFGGNTGTTLGTVSGDATLRQARTGIFGWQWSLARSVGGQPVAVHGGDQLTALVTTTITLAGQLANYLVAWRHDCHECQRVGCGADRRRSRLRDYPLYRWHAQVQG